MESPYPTIESQPKFLIDMYGNGTQPFITKVSDKMAYSNSVGPDQTAPSGSTLFAIPLSILGNNCMKIKISAKKI